MVKEAQVKEAQKISLRANWTTLGAPAVLLITPKVKGTETLEPGFLKFG